MNVLTQIKNQQKVTQGEVSGLSPGPAPAPWA